MSSTARPSKNGRDSDVRCYPIAKHNMNSKGVLKLSLLVATGRSYKSLERELFDTVDGTARKFHNKSLQQIYSRNGVKDPTELLKASLED